MTVKQVKRNLRISNLIVVVIVLLILGFNAFYVIQEQEQAVVVTFGRADIVSTPGPHFKIPFVQEVEIIPTVVNGFSIGYTNEGGSTPTNNYDTYDWEQYQGNVTAPDGTIMSESMMITSDYNFVNVDFYLQYKVSDPERFLFASENPELILRNLALSYIRDTIGMHNVDEVITTGKTQIQTEIREKLSAHLIEQDIGLSLVNITIQDSEPPMEVIDAFKNVETAKQGKETAINTARKYESEKVPAARAQVDAVLKNADADREKRINEAKAQVAVFNAMFDEYQKNPMMTRQRMFYETMEEVLPGMKIIIDNGDGTTSKVLPLDSFAGVGTTSSAGSASANNAQPESEE